MKILWYIFIYSFLGFLLEVGYARAVHAEKKDRKCLFFLPLCPVYGVGATAIVMLPDFVRMRLWLLMPLATLAATAAEYAMSWFYETFWRVSFWDYSSLPGSIQGRVCLPFSLAWCFLSLPLVFWIHPVVERVADLLPAALLLPLCGVFMADFLWSGVLLRRTGTTEALRWYRR